MAECSGCGENGMFLKLNNEGLCKACQALMESSSVHFSRVEREFVRTQDDGIRIGGIRSSIESLSSGNLYIAAMYAISAKSYDLAEKLLTLSEQKAENIVTLHFCYNTWIDLLYKQREDLKCLARCIEYCKKDIVMYPKLCKDLFFADQEVHIPSFERLAIIYEKQGDLRAAASINELAISYKTIMFREKYQKRLDKVRAKMNK